jgi:hypothetical protein
MSNALVFKSDFNDIIDYGACKTLITEIYFNFFEALKPNFFA